MTDPYMEKARKFIDKFSVSFRNTHDLTFAVNQFALALREAVEEEREACIGEICVHPNEDADMICCAHAKAIRSRSNGVKG